MKLLEIVPLIIFFVLSKPYGIIVATGGLVVSSIIAFAILYFAKKKIEKSTIISLVLLIFFGLLTVIFNNPTFIKVKLSIVSLIFSAILFYGFMSQKTFIKKMLGTESDKFGASQQQWRRLDFYWSIYFGLLAILNEIIWRNFSEEDWINFKVFGSTGLLFIFCIITFMPFFRKNNNR
jgi:intracellular septation protein